MWSREANDLGWRAYLGELAGNDDIPAYAAPARVDDVAGLPPAWIGVGALDVFRDEDIEYASRMLARRDPDRAARLPGRAARLRDDRPALGDRAGVSSATSRRRCDGRCVRSPSSRPPTDAEGQRAHEQHHIPAARGAHLKADRASATIATMARRTSSPVVHSVGEREPHRGAVVGADRDQVEAVAVDGRHRRRRRCRRGPAKWRQNSTCASAWSAFMCSMIPAAASTSGSGSAARVVGGVDPAHAPVAADVADVVDGRAAGR